MKRSVFLVAVTLLGTLLLAPVSVSAAPAGTDADTFKVAADQVFLSWANWHLGRLGTTVYDVYETRGMEYTVASNVGTVRGSYTIVTRQKCDGTACSRKGAFQASFTRQADGSWRISSYTTTPEPM